MSIVVAMTAVTRHGQLYLGLDLIFVTCVAIYPIVLSVQSKICLRIMIKLPCEPIVGTVTELAFRAKTFLVNVVLRMA